MRSTMLVPVLAGLLTLAAPPTEQSHAAAQPGLPRAAFPPHTSLHLHQHVANTVLDCSWNFAACDPLTGRPVRSEPATHSHTMEHLHRLDGWGEDGVVPSGMSFILWSNEFRSAGSAAGACSDMATAEQGTGFRERVRRLPRARGERGWIVYHFGGETESLVCAWTGVSEVESAADWETGNAHQGRTARRYQREQIGAALSAASIE